MAQLYQNEIKSSQEAKEEHIKQAKEKSLEEQRRVEKELKQDNERKRQETEAINKAREREREVATVQISSDSQDTDNSNSGAQTTETPQPDTSSTIGNDWSQVSPEQASTYMSAKTGVPASKWLDIIYKESSGNPYALNSLSCYGMLQIMQSVHGQVSQLSPQAYLDKAVSIYQESGGTAWETW